MERYKVTLTGGPTSMIMHTDDVLKADELCRYRGAAKGKGKGAKSVAGDDRTPPWSYWTYFTADGQHVALTELQLSAMLLKGGAEFKMSGKRGRSLKAATQTLLRVVDPFWPIRVQVDGRLVLIKTADVFGVGVDAAFEKHVENCLRLGVILDVRRASVGQSKHVRVRPKFPPGWEASGEIQIIDESVISGETLEGILEYCGDFVGLGDWRPSAPKKPGPHGRFTARVERIG